MSTPAVSLSLQQSPAVIPAMSRAACAMVDFLAEASHRVAPQVLFVTEHQLHKGVYTRSVSLPVPPPDKPLIVTGVLVKAATTLILHGNATVWLGEDEAPLHVSGSTVLAGSAGRKQVFKIYSEFTMHMVLRTNAKTIEEAQHEFTDEVDLLVPLSDVDRHKITITEE